MAQWKRISLHPDSRTEKLLARTGRLYSEVLPEGTRKVLDAVEVTLYLWNPRARSKGIDVANQNASYT